MDKTSKKTVTLRQVAEHAKVSTSTASLVLNGKGDISQATRDRVHTAVSELDYRLKVTKSKSVSSLKLRFLKIAKHGQTVNRDHNHFISDYIDGMSIEASRRDYVLEVVTLNDTDLPSILEAIEGSDLGGVIALGTELSEEDIIALSKCGQCIVFIDTFFPFLEANFVNMDNDQTIFAVVSSFKKSGFKRIGFVGSHTNVANFKLREEAFHRACSKLDIQTSERDIFSVAATREEAYKQAKLHLEKADSIAEAYFCVNDIVAFGVMRALQELGYNIPFDVSVVGFDNLPMSSLLSPSLTTIDVPKQQIGSMAIRLIDDMIIAHATNPPIKALVTGKLIIRESSS
ncbi:LacI family DNA-binding transcriptional regulator [Kangiella sp.]|uniref:LacI family DNA-binding transcriptional regulator n=1 Tax=Kangiella sp. TaxID=1920245 RepID=UPI003A95D4C1